MYWHSKECFGKRGKCDDKCRCDCNSCVTRKLTTDTFSDSFSSSQVYEIGNATTDAVEGVWKCNGPRCRNWNSQRTRQFPYTDGEFKRTMQMQTDNVLALEGVLWEKRQMR